MEIISIILAFGAMLFWGLGDFLIQKSVRKIGNIQTLAWIGIIGSLVILPFVLSDIHLIWQWPTLVILIALGIIVFFQAATQFEALKRGKLSVVEVILILELPFTIFFGIAFLNEVINLWQIILIVTLLMGVAMVTITRRNKYLLKILKALMIKVSVLEKSIWLAGLAAITVALINFLTALIAKTASPLLAIWVPWTIFTIICIAYLIGKDKMKDFFKISSKNKYLIILTALVDTAAWLFFAFAVQYKDLSITIAITESFPVIALFLGVWLNKEKISKLQYLGAALAICSSIIISFT